MFRLDGFFPRPVLRVLRQSVKRCTNGLGWWIGGVVNTPAGDCDFTVITKAMQWEDEALDFKTAIIIIIRLLSLAPAGYLATPDNGAERRYTGWCGQVP
jgi:hypothetical protein